MSDSGPFLAVVVVVLGFGCDFVFGLSLGSPGNVPAWISSMLLNPSPSESSGSIAAKS